MDDHKTNLFTYTVVLAGNMLTICIGLAASWSSPMLIKLADGENSDNPLGYGITNEQASWIVSLLNIGSMCGAIPAGFLTNRIGRKYVLLLTGGMYFAAFIMGAFANIIELFYVMRIIAGLAIGFSTVLGMYIAEISHHKDRGTLTSTVAFSAYIGVLGPYVLGPYLPMMAFNLICAAFALFFCIVFLFVPESPHFLVTRGKMEEAKQALSKLRSNTPESIEKEFESIKNHVESHEEGSFFDIFKSRLLIKSLIIAVVLNACTYLTGVATVGGYSQEVFESAGTSIPSSLDSIIVGLFQAGVGICAMFVIQKLKFKILFVSSLVVVAISNLVTGIFFYLKEATDNDVSSLSWWPIASLVVAFSAFCGGVITVLAVVTSELFPTSVRSPAFTFVHTWGFLESFLLAKFFHSIIDAIGTYGYFWVFTAVTLLFAVFAQIFLIETNGKTFEEIQQLLAGKKPIKETKQPA